MATAACTAGTRGSRWTALHFVTVSLEATITARAACTVATQKLEARSFDCQRAGRSLPSEAHHGRCLCYAAMCAGQHLRTRHHVGGRAQCWEQARLCTSRQMRH